jgi:hypothetical protein
MPRRSGLTRWFAAAILAAGPAAATYFVRADAVAPLEVESERAIEDPMRVRAGEVRAPSQLSGEIDRGHRRALRDAGIVGAGSFLLIGLIAGRLHRP